MANWYYYNASGQELGPISPQQIKELASQGTIGPETLLRSEKDRNPVKASQLLDFPKPGFFDIGFTRFVTNVWISFIWIIIIMAHALGFITLLVRAGMMLAGGDDEASLVAFLVMVSGTVGLLLSLLFTRIILEVIIVIFRIETHLRAIRAKSEEQKN